MACPSSISALIGSRYQGPCAARRGDIRRLHQKQRLRRGSFMLLSQIRDGTDRIRVVVREGTEAYAVNGAAGVYQLAIDCARSGKGLAALIRELGLGEAVDLEAAYEEGRLLLPISHPDPTHMHVTGTGLTHLGSAATRDAM